MTAESFDSYIAYYNENWNVWMTIKQQLFVFLRELYAKHESANARLARFLEARAGIHVDLPILIPRDLRMGRYGDLDRLSLLMHWSIEKLLPRYRVDVAGQPAGQVADQQRSTRDSLDSVRAR
jgi:hypothetical protein